MRGDTKVKRRRDNLGSVVLSLHEIIEGKVWGRNWDFEKGRR